VVEEDEEEEAAMGYSYMPLLALKRGGCRSAAGGQYDAGSS
jgi:hypothetical protein